MHDRKKELGKGKVRMRRKSVDKGKICTRVKRKWRGVTVYTRRGKNGNENEWARG